MIPFTQYLRPDGRRRLVKVERPPAVEAKAHKILERGYRFECEMLDVEPPLPDVSFTITDEDGDQAIELCRNGPEVLEAVDRLIMAFEP